MNIPKSIPGPTEGEILTGSARVEITYTESGKPELVAVKLLPVRKVAQYFELDADPAACAELLTGKARGWADTITNDSVYRVIEEGERLNASPFANHLAFLNRRGERVKAMMPGAAVNPSPVSSPASA